MADLTDEEFLPPERTFSPETLHEWRALGLDFVGNGFQDKLFEAVEADWFENQEPAVLQRLIEDADGWADALGEDSLTPDEQACAHNLSWFATRAGYLLARTVLGTDAEDLRWSDDREADGGRICDIVTRTETSAIGPLASETIAEVMVELAYDWAYSMGVDLDESDLYYMIGIAFDNAMGIALAEHDLRLGRSG
jgi:hypothetical protein